MHLLGGLLAVTAFFLYGSAKANAIRRELETLEGMLSLLREVALRLALRREKLGEIFASCKNPFPETPFLQRIAMQGGGGYGRAWQTSLSLLTLPKDALPPLHTLGDTLGQLPLEPQKEQLDFCIARLEELQAKLSANASQKQKSTVALWTLGGLLTALLLL